MDNRAWGACILFLLSPWPIVSSQHRPSCLSRWARDLGASGFMGGFQLGPGGIPTASSPAQQFLPTKQTTDHGTEKSCPVPSFLSSPSSTTTSAAWLWVALLGNRAELT